MTRTEAMRILAISANNMAFHANYREAVRMAIHDIMRCQSKCEVVDNDFTLGDEILDITTLSTGVITAIDHIYQEFYVMWSDGSCGNWYYNIKDFKKTGRSFPQIKEVIDGMNR